jgi:putative RNA 2'-phosphotransferase
MCPTHLSKFMSLVLRHRARAFGLTPDAEGFVPLADFVAVVAREQRLAADEARTAILDVVETGVPWRYEVRGDLIRATYGHSRRNIPEVVYPPVEPPATLFHGTAPDALPAIRAAGLKPMRRQYVHLSTTLERAQSVAGRHTRTPVILLVRALAAHQAGVIFHAPEPRHYLARAIPAEFVLFPAETDSRECAATPL